MEYPDTALRSVFLAFRRRHGVAPLIVHKRKGPECGLPRGEVDPGSADEVCGWCPAPLIRGGKWSRSSLSNERQLGELWEDDLAKLREWMNWIFPSRGRRDKTRLECSKVRALSHAVYRLAYLGPGDYPVRRGRGRGKGRWWWWWDRIGGGRGGLRINSYHGLSTRTFTFFFVFFQLHNWSEGIYYCRHELEGGAAQGYR